MLSLEMRKSSHRAVRINEALAVRVETLAAAVKYSFNHFAEVAIEEMVELCEAQAAQRQEPQLCALVDAALASRKPLPRSGGAVNSGSVLQVVQKMQSKSLGKSQTPGSGALAVPALPPPPGIPRATVPPDPRAGRAAVP